MALNTSNKLHLQDAIRTLANALDNAPHGTKSSLKKDFCKQYDMSLPTLHRQLKSVGWTSGRKRRSDAGTTSQDDGVLVEIAAMLKEGLRRNGKATMKITTARSILSQSGRKINVSNAQLARLLRQNNMDEKSQKKPTSAQSIVSKHPNHMHEVDPSLCLLYYTPTGKQHTLRDDEIYKNKPDWVEKIGKLKCWRYVLVDHFSGSIIVKYYQSKGETQANMYDFLLYAWNKQDGKVFHGVPTMLYCDAGSAHTAGGIQNALKSLKVNFESHKAGNARATGSVEGAQNIVETQFESRLKYEPVTSVDELNDRAEQWYKAWNSNSIPEYDSRISRRGLPAGGLARYGIWQTIREHELRELPEISLCRYLMVNDPAEKPVSKELEVSFKFPGDKRVTYWDVSHIPDIYPSQKVMIQPLIYGEEKQVLISVTDYQENTQSYEASPVEFDSRSGIKQSGAIAGEQYISMPDNTVDKAGKKMDKAAWGNLSTDDVEKQRKKNAVPFGGLNSLSHLKDIDHPDYMQRKGTEIKINDPVKIEVKPLSIVATANLLISDYGLKLDIAKNALIRKWYPDGVLEEELPALAERLTKRPVLRVVGED